MTGVSEVFPKMFDGTQEKYRFQVNIVVMLTALTEGTKVACIFKYQAEAIFAQEK